MLKTTNFASLAVIAACLSISPRNLDAQTSQPLKHAGGPTAGAITAADAMTRVYIFADDSMMGRRSGTAGGLKGTAYIEREVRRLGLVPAGDNGTFFQAVPLYTRSFDTSSLLAAGTTPVTGGKDYYPLHPGGAARPVDGAQIIFAGNSADPTNLIPAAQAVGKVVLVAGPPAGVSARYPGAAAFMVVVAEPVLPQLRRAVMSEATLMKSDADTVSKPLTIALPAASVAMFLGVSVANARPGTLGSTLRGEIRFKTVDTPARNVVALLPGSDARLRGQYVAIGAHNDHIGTRAAGPLDHDSVRAFNAMAARIYIARTRQLPGFPGSGITPAERASIVVNVDSLRRNSPARLDSINNGADDDGSGTVAVLEMAEMFAAARVKPKRSLLFVWHAGEELGLFGSEYFTDHPTVARDSIVAQLNVDMVGRGQAADLPGGNPGYLQLIGSRRLSTELGDMVESVNRTGRHGFTFDYAFDADGHPENYYCRSDHYEYARYGIPVVFMSTGGHVDYHQITDEPQYVNYPHLTRVTKLMADLASSVANLDHRVVVDKPKPDPKATCQQ
ncbi:MAG: M28 family peptidase [Gemmatimonadaceae bacterium]|nr:M28 family peptidase [Gemmatimonadaceae bacterium]